jgi:hypothetical protein
LKFFKNGPRTAEGTIPLSGIPGIPGIPELRIPGIRYYKNNSC